MDENFVLVGPALPIHPFSLEQLFTSPASTHSLFWNLPPTQGPSLLSCQLSLYFSDSFRRSLRSGC